MKFARDTDDHYAEPDWCSRRLLEIEDFGAPGARILDPAAGWGRIPRAVAAAGYTAIASDIVDRFDRRGLEHVAFHLCDFLERSPVRSTWSIISNPPYRHLQAFCERSLAAAVYKVAMLAPLRRLPAAHWLERMPLKSVRLLTPRPSMPPGSWIEAGNTPGGGSQDFCWLVFNKRTPPVAPRLRWLHRDGVAPPSLLIENAVTADDPNGPRPPIGDGWHLVRRTLRGTSWRRIDL